MVKILVFIVIYVFSELGYAQTTDGEKIDSPKLKAYAVRVEINNINSDSGKVYFALYDSENNFNIKNPLKNVKSDIKEGSVQVTFEGLKPKAYAVVCYHDANLNGKIDFQENGIPTEDYGLTNNVKIVGSPQFDDAKFELINKDLSFEIKF
jgi:uncharacterized protein (DUF2141 family)